MTVTVTLKSAGGATFTKTLPDPTVTPVLPSPWSQVDVGAPAMVGSASFAANVFTVKGGGADIWGAVDQHHFVHQPLAGDGQIVARVTSQTGAANTWAKAGVMIKQSTTAGSPYALMCVTPAEQGTAFQAGFNVNTQTAPSPWLKLVRVGSLVTGYSSFDGKAWTQLGTFTLSGAAKIGLFVSSHSATELGTATFDNVVVGPVTSVPPPPPPPSGAFFDDFNGPAGSKPNPAFWSISTQSWTGGIQQYNPSQVYLDGAGNCVIEAKQAGGAFVSGAFCGKAGGYPQPGAAVLLAWGYGRLEARIKMPKGFSGSWPAWWFLGEEFDGSSNAPNGWPFCGEMDIMEGFSDSTYFYATSHGPGGPNSGGAYNQSQVPIFASDIGVSDFSTDYHVYWCERKLNSMTVGVDSLTKATFTASQVIPPSQYTLNKRVFPIFDYMLYGSPDVSKMPAKMLIDWVRFTPA